MNTKQFIDSLISIMGMADITENGLIGFNPDAKEFHVGSKRKLMELAKHLGQTVITEPYNCKAYPVMSSFNYNGWKFFTIYSAWEVWED